MRELLFLFPFLFLTVALYTYPGEPFNLAMITRENVVRQRAFVTCNRGKTSDRDTIVGSRIPGRTEARTKSLRGEHGRALLSHSLRPLRRDQSFRGESLSQRGALPPRRTGRPGLCSQKVAFLEPKLANTFKNTLGNYLGDNDGYNLGTNELQMCW